MANNKGIKGAGDDKISGIARIVISLAVVLLVGYMVSRADNLQVAETSGVTQAEADDKENSQEDSVKELIESQKEEGASGTFEAPTTQEEIRETTQDAIQDESQDTSQAENPDVTQDTVREGTSDIATDENETEILTADEEVEYKFRSKKYLNQHYEKHGIEMGFASAEEYERAASAVINNPDALYKTEAEDGDGVYYVEATNEFAILSTDGYIRTYFNPSGGKAYFERQ